MKSAMAYIKDERPRLSDNKSVVYTVRRAAYRADFNYHANVNLSRVKPIGLASGEANRMRDDLGMYFGSET